MSTFNLSVLRADDREDDIRDMIERMNGYGFSDAAKLRYLANEFDQAVFTNGYWMDLSLSRERNEEGITRIKVTSHRSGYKCEISTQTLDWRNENVVEVMKNEVKNTLGEAFDYIEDETGMDFRDSPVIDISNAEGYEIPEYDDEVMNIPNRGIL